MTKWWRVLAATLLIGCLTAESAWAVASKRRSLTRTEAWYAALRTARDMYLRTEETTGYAVAPTEKCLRRSRTTVDCDYRLYDDTSASGRITCAGTIRVRLVRYRVRASLVTEPHCYEDDGTHGF